MGTRPKRKMAASRSYPATSVHKTEEREISTLGKRLSAVSVPGDLAPVFLRAQSYVRQYFKRKKQVPSKAQIEVSGERYILVRAASMSKEFFDLVTSLYQDRGEDEARTVASSFLFDMAHAIGKADAKSFYSKMGVSKPVEKLSAGPVHFAYTGWAFVKILPESNPTPDENYFLIYDHPFSFEADTWMKNGKKTDFPVCIMNAGYSSGWCEESFGLPLVAVEIECQAKGDEHCRFIMAPPSKIERYLDKYSPHGYLKSQHASPIAIPEFFQRKRLEDELMKSEETVRALLNAPKDRALLLDREGRILALNETAAKAFGRRAEDLIGQNAFDLFPPKLGKERRAYHERVVRTGKSIRYQDRRDGRWMDTTADPICDAQGRVARVAVVSRDMTEYKEIQDALRKEKEFNATLIQTSPAFFVALDPKGRTLLMNEAMLGALGYNQSEVVGKDYLSTFVPEADRRALKEIFRTPAEEDRPKIIESRMVTKDGRELIVEWHCRHVVKEDHELDYFFALGIDVTERKKAEAELIRHRNHLEDLVKERTDRLMRMNQQLQKEIAVRAEAERALQKSETMLRAIFDQTFQFIAVLKLDGTVIKVNKTAVDFVNAKEEEINGRPFWATPWWTHSREEQNRLKKAIGEAASGELVRFETVHTAPDGRVMSIDFSVKPVRDRAGKIVLLIAEGRDITALKSAVEDLRKRELELEVQSRRLEEANVALKVLLKQMENKKREDEENVLSNVNQLVLPYLERLKRTNLDKDQRILVDMLETNLGHITSPMVKRLSSSVLNLTPMEIRISHLVKEGLTNKEIAELLGTSLNTVTTHRYKIRTKLGLRNKGVNLRSYLLSLEE